MKNNEKKYELRNIYWLTVGSCSSKVLQGCFDIELPFRNSVLIICNSFGEFCYLTGADRPK